MASKYSYMANFSLLRNLAIAGGGGVAYAGGYLGAKYLRGDLKDPETAVSETVGNLSGGLAGGVGGYLLTKALKA
jgi:F0F1-type ATP synthase membrane subunit c/vacuolar-type H+-ATPase subunit K